MALPVGLISGLIQVAPSIARFFGGGKAERVTHEVVEAAKVVTGAIDPQEALDALKNRHELREQYRVMIEGMEAKLEALHLADTRNARSRDVTLQTETGGNQRADVLAYMAVFGFLALMAVLVFVPLDKGIAKDALLILVGALAVIVKDIYNFEFGSSRGSKDKLAELLKRTDRQKESPDG